MELLHLFQLGDMYPTFISKVKYYMKMFLE